MTCDDSCYEEVAGAVCLMRADGSEHILQYNSMALDLFQCETREDFRHLSAASFLALAPVERLTVRVEQV